MLKDEKIFETINQLKQINMEKKEILSSNSRAISNLENVIYHLEKTGKKLEIALCYEMIAKLSAENEKLANEISNSIL